MPLCVTCKVRPVENFGDGGPSFQCVECNNQDINQSDNQREWDHYHPGEPCPASELNKVR